MNDQKNEIAPSNEMRLDSLNKKYYGCACGTSDGKIWLEKPEKAIVNADRVFIRWHPFSPKIIRLVNKGEKVEVNAVLDYKLDAFALLTKDTFNILNNDTLYLGQGKRATIIWEDTVLDIVKIRLRKTNLDADYFSSGPDSMHFFMVLESKNVEILPQTKWYYLKTNDGSDACILGKYLDF